MAQTTYETKDGKMRPVPDQTEKEKKDAAKSAAAAPKGGYEAKQEGY